MSVGILQVMKSNQKRLVRCQKGVLVGGIKRKQTKTAGNKSIEIRRRSIDVQKARSFFSGSHSSYIYLFNVLRRNLTSNNCSGTNSSCGSWIRFSRFLIFGEESKVDGERKSGGRNNNLCGLLWSICGTQSRGRFGVYKVKCCTDVTGEVN